MVPKKGCTDLPPGGGPKCVPSVVGQFAPSSGANVPPMCVHANTYDAYERGDDTCLQRTGSDGLEQLIYAV